MDQNHPPPPFVPLRQRFGQALLEARQTRGLSRAEVSRRTGVSPGRLARIEAGRGRVECDEFFTLAAVLGVDPFKLVRKGGPPGWTEEERLTLLLDRNNSGPLVVFKGIEYTLRHLVLVGQIRIGKLQIGWETQPPGCWEV